MVVDVFGVPDRAGVLEHEVAAGVVEAEPPEEEMVRVKVPSPLSMIVWSLLLTAMTSVKVPPVFRLVVTRVPFVLSR